MRFTACLTACAVFLAVSAAMAAPADQPLPLAGKLARAKAAMDEGKLEDAVAAARSVAQSTRDDALKTDALKVVADGLRKKGDWALAIKAYAEVKERYEKGTEGWVRAEATVDVLQVSPGGVYPGLSAAAAPMRRRLPLRTTRAWPRLS